MTTHETAWLLFQSIRSVCLYVCLSDNFRKLWCTKFIFVWSTGKFRIWRSSGQGQGAKKVNNHPVFPQQKPACQHKSGSLQCENSITNSACI